MKYRGKIGIARVQIRVGHHVGFDRGCTNALRQPIAMFNQKSKADSFSVIPISINIGYPEQSDTKTNVSQEVEYPVGKIFTENDLLITWTVAVAMRDEFQLVLMVEKRTFYL